MPHPHNKKIQSFWLITGIIFIAFNLRPAITSVGPVISSIRAELHMPNGAAGFLTALPLLSFAVLSPLAPKLGQRLGNERTLWLGLVILLIGVFDSFYRLYCRFVFRNGTYRRRDCDW